MVAIKLVVLSLVCVCATAIPDIAPGQVTRNTIFADERFEGEVFENVDAFADTELTTTSSPYRLPTTTRPSRYNLHWFIDMPRLRYSGNVLVTLAATQAGVSEIVLHSAHVEIRDVVLTLGAAEVNTTYVLQPEYHFLRVHLTDSVLQNGVDYTLNITFDANMRDDMYGIYHSWYRNEGGDSRIEWMATTQFQATAARFAFPCYDEPSFKATFDVTITRPTEYGSWFCTQELTRNPTPNHEGYTSVTYRTTPVMSTYLLALIVANYEPRSDSTTVIRHEVIARNGAIEDGQAEFAQRTGMGLLNWMEAHTNYPFLQQSANLKMTQAAIPDFGAGAMENWGLLTYREAYLLHKEGETNGYFKQLIAYILSHEIAHMWFGNLVTNDWWDVLWLNEGFARYYQYYLTANASIEGFDVDYVGLERRFINEQVHTSLLSDSSNNPQPLTNPGVGSPASVSAMFSTITYNKGAAVIRMTEHLLGTNTHREGLRRYLVNNAHSTVQPIDLFNELDLAGREAGSFSAYGPDFNFIEYYKSWTEQPGHPVLQVNIEHSTGQMSIYQRRFNINTGFSNQSTRYIIPITFTTDNSANFDNTKPSHILTEPFTVINRNAYGNLWTIFNIQQTGFYRVHYDDFTWDLIAQALRDPVQREQRVIHEFNRAQIVNDVFQFARSGIMTYERAMNILSFLQYETEYVPWVAAITGFNWIRNRLHGNPTELAALNELILGWASYAMSQLTYRPIANEPFMRSYLRYQLAPLMCNLGDPECISQANIQFDLMKNGGEDVPVDSRNWVYCNALRRGNDDDFNFLWERFQTHNVYTEKILLLQTLGCTSHDASLATLLDAIVLPNNIIRRQDYTTAFNTAVSGNEENTQKVFAYIRLNLAAVTLAFGSPVTPLSYVSARLRNENEVVAFQTWANNTRSILDQSYNSVYGGAASTLQSINLAYTIADDLNNYFVNGDQPITSTTLGTPATPTTTAQPALAEPTTPELPDPSSAVTTFVSIFMLTVVAFVHIIL